MPHLVIVVISLMLTSMMFLVTAKYSPINAALAHMTQTKAVEGIKRIESGVINYAKANRDATGQVVLPAAGTDMYSLLVPEYTFLPGLTANLDWFVQAQMYDDDMPAIFICITPLNTLPDHDLKGLSRARKQLGDAAYVGTGCTDRTSVTGNHLSYWVIGSHYDNVIDEPAAEPAPEPAPEPTP